MNQKAHPPRVLDRCIASVSVTSPCINDKPSMSAKASVNPKVPLHQTTTFPQNGPRPLVFLHGVMGPLKMDF